MRCLAIGDTLLSNEHFDMVLKNCGLFEKYRSILWKEGQSRSQFREVIRRLETLGSRAYIPSDEIFNAIQDVEVLFIHYHPVPGELIEAAPDLKYILSARGGVENIDIAAAKERGITIINCPAHNAVAVAEYTIGLIISEMRNISRADASLRKGIWRESYPNAERIGELSDAVVGLIGFGTIGRLVAERLRAFGTTVLVYDPYVSASEIEAEGCKAVTMEVLLKTADVVSLHGRIPNGAPPLISAKELSIMKPTSYLINTARAVLVDMDALYDALKNRKIMGAAIDVFPKEPLPENYPFLKLDNCTITNHRGGDTYNSYAKAPVLLLKQFKELLDTGKTRFMIR
ncbi:MAG: 2-hydroxyacid dehydrogenase [Acetivibrionales bacterium]